MKCHFIRHGEATFNTLGLCNADASIKNSLTAQGARQAQAVANLLSKVPLDAIFVSELPRAQETAQIINGRRGLPISIDARINDRVSGFEGRPVADYLAAVAHDPLHYKSMSGESYLELKRRVLLFLKDLADKPVQQPLVVTHHEVLQIINGYFKDLADIDMWRTWIDHGQILEFEF